MLATNFPDEDHVHRCIKPVDPDNLPAQSRPRHQDGVHRGVPVRSRTAGAERRGADLPMAA